MQIGADPEFAVWHPERGYLPAHAVGVPDRHHKLEFTQKDLWGFGWNLNDPRSGKIFRDGFGLELNTYPFTCIGNLLENIKKILARTRDALNLSAHGMQLRAPASIEVDLASALAEAPKDVVEVGCSPSFNIYKGWGEKQFGMWNPTDNPVRMFAGHLHFSPAQYEGLNFTKREDVERSVRALDYYVGIPLTYIFADEPETFRRRVFYGQAGEYRLPPHGLEWRTPGAEIWRHQAITALAMALSRYALTHSRAIMDEAVTRFGKEFDGLVQRAINTGDGLEDMLKPIYECSWSSPEKEVFVRLRTNREELGLGVEKGVLESPQEAHIAWPNFPRGIVGEPWASVFNGLKL